MTFCPKCGAERKVGSKFCHNCGYDFKTIDSSRSNVNSSSNNSNFDPTINSGTNSNTYSNTNSGTNHGGSVPANQNSHSLAKISGYLFALLIPIIGVVIGIYLLMSENQEVHKHGKAIIGIAIFIQLISMLSMFR